MEKRGKNMRRYIICIAVILSQLVVETLNQETVEIGNQEEDAKRTTSFDEKTFVASLPDNPQPQELLKMISAEFELLSELSSSEVISTDGKASEPEPGGFITQSQNILEFGNEGQTELDKGASSGKEAVHKSEDILEAVSVEEKASESESSGFITQDPLWSGEELQGKLVKEAPLAKQASQETKDALKVVSSEERASELKSSGFSTKDLAGFDEEWQQELGRTRRTLLGEDALHEGDDILEAVSENSGFITQELPESNEEGQSELDQKGTLVKDTLEDKQDDEILSRGADMNGGLIAADVISSNPTELANSTSVLERIKEVLNSEDIFSDVSILDSYDWFSDDTVFVPTSRRRRSLESAAHRYRRYQQPLRAYVPEDSPIGTPVLEIPRNYGGKLEIVFPAENTPFRVSSKTAILETTQLLDYEKQRMYTLILRDAENVDADSPFYSHDVIVYVTDVNDNIPRFNMESYTGNVNSRSRVGSPVAQLNASDADSGPRGRIGFLIEDQDSPFTVNPNTWILETNGKALDQSASQYPVYVKTFDRGYPMQISSSVLLGVSKVNELPKFSKTSYSFTFSEKVLPGVIIGRVLARSFSNIPVGYELVPTPSEVYAISARGEISLKRLVEHENDGTSVVTVEAKELTDNSPLSSRVSVTLVVQKGDWHPTIFTEPVYRADINEDVSPGFLVTSVAVTDCDCAASCQCTGNEMRFALVGADGYFTVNEVGEIHTLKEFEYIVQNAFQFIVTAQDRLDNGEEDDDQARAYVQVSLLDVNNNAPKFTEMRYNFVIDEDSDVGHFVGVVQATDDDVKGAPLTYTLKSDSSESGAFRIEDTRFGIITLASTLKFAPESKFTLVVEVSDGALRSEVPVDVIVADVNDNAPQFTSCPNSANVEENLSVGAIVAILKAEDKDRGLNAQIEYFIEASYDLYSDDHVQLFKINNRTGELETAHVLDREKKSNHFVIVSAKDGSVDSDLRQVGYCQFIINVDDDNDNFPFFEVARYQTSVESSAKIGTTVLKVGATDADIGANAEVTYTIEGENALFQVNSDGLITVKSSLVSELGMKTFTITATNTRPYTGEGDPSDGSQQTTIEIFITDQPLPKFIQSSYKTEVREDTLAGTAILNVTAIPTSSYASMIYYLADLRYTSAGIRYPFTVDHSTGLILLASKLDFESREAYAFSVNAHEVGSLEMIETSVEIIVVDVNDVSPIFGRTSYDATVSEDAQIGSTIIRIRAIDHDPDGVNISYEIELSEDSPLFTLRTQSTSVEILTNAKFDREQREYYNVILVAKDNGVPQLESFTLVTVHVLDEDDSPPVFDAESYEVSVPENTKVGQIVKTVVTRDKDYGRNAWAYFFIASGNDGRFQMTSEHLSDRSHGNLVVTNRLDYEVRSEYNLTVVASNKQFSAVTTIRVKVTDANDDPPYFKRSLYNTSLPENTVPGTLVLTVEAVDHDSPADRLVYSLDDAASTYFTIGPSNGFITTSLTGIDREKTPVIIFSAIVSDGENEARTIIEVMVLEVNEPPYFPNTPYVGFIEENQPQGTPVRYVVAYDDDDPKLNEGNNSKIVYSIDTNTGENEIDSDGKMFKIDPRTGLVSSSRVFNLENIRRNLTILVRATDGGTPKRSGVVGVTIVIRDISEFPPKFMERVFTAAVPEDTELGKDVLKLTVGDEDFTNVGHMYSITSGNYPFAFYMRPETGEILVAGVLDYEAKREYNLTIAISERSISKIFETDFATVILRILDSNDQPPVFIPKTYYRKIPEDVAVGTEVRVVTCSDADTGVNAVPVFSITHGNIDDFFEVVSDRDDKNLGVVKVAGKLDRERKSSYTLEITATDIGGLTDTATLIVELQDVNDSPPVFVPAYYEGTISEGVATEQHVVTISATDLDQSPNGGPLTFTLKNFQNKFQLKNINDHSVELHTKMLVFKRDETPLYEVTVVATDNGEPTQSAEAMVFVSVEDGKSDHEPFDGRMVIIVYALNGQFPGGTIGYVYYRDDDYQVDTGEYALQSQGPGNYFTVEASTGRIRCYANLPNDTYTLNVTFGESGSNFRKTVLSQIEVRVLGLSEAAVQHAVVLQFPLRNPGLFVDSLYMKLVGLLAEILAVPSDHVFVFSIGKSSESVGGFPFAVDVWIAVSRTDGTFMDSTYVYAELEMNYGKLVNLGISQLQIGLDKCAIESKSIGVCKNVIMTQDLFTVVSSYYGQIPAPSSSLIVVGIDTVLQGVYEVLPEPAPDCALSPCRNGGTCHDVTPQGYVCECSVDYRGPECQLTTLTFKRPNSYIWLTPLVAYELSSISFEFISEVDIGNGLLLYQGPVQGNHGHGSGNGMQDFLAVSLINGFLSVAISLGGRPTSFDLRQGDRLDDGKWHHVELKRFKKEIRLIIDHCDSAQIMQEDGRFMEDRSSCEVVSHSLENFIYLNGLGPLQIGGSSIFLFPVSNIATQSFYGCIRHIQDNGHMYDLRHPIREVNTTMGCDHGCHSNPCKNGGYCETEDYSALTCCTCPPGYTGCDCSKRPPSTWYLDDSFSEYNVSDASTSQDLFPRARRAIFSMFPRSSPNYYTDIVIRLRPDPGLQNAVLFYLSSTGNSVSELGINGGVLYYMFKFADNTKTVSLPGASISDNKWHSVHVRQQGNKVSLQLDNKAKAYGTTGSIMRLIDLSQAQMYVGGIPNFVSHDHDQATSSGLWNNNQQLSHVHANFHGCISGVRYNGAGLEDVFPFYHIHVEDGCPCAAETVLECDNSGTCADEQPPFCLCPQGFSGDKCQQVVLEASTEFHRVTQGPAMRGVAGHRVLDPVWICVVLMSLVILIFLLCLIHALPVMNSERPLIEDDAHDSIMAYQEQGVDEVDATEYDITLLRQHSRHRETTSSAIAGSYGVAASAAGTQGERGGLSEGDGVNGGYTKDLAVQAGSVKGMRRKDFGAQAGSVKITAKYKRMDKGENAVQGMDMLDSGGRMESRIMERVVKANKDVSGFPADDMVEIREEGKYSDVDDLSDLEWEDEELRSENVGIDVFAVDWDHFVVK